MPFRIVFLSFLLLSSISRADAEDAPDVRVTQVRRVFHNGEHNAFTDLIRFKGRYYLAFRSCPDGHMVHPTASIIVLTSDDATSWRQVHRFRVAKRDTRDPHFLEFKEKLFVFTGTWYSGDTTLARDQYDLNKHLGYAAWSHDGADWHGPVLLDGTFGHYIWRAAAYGNQAFLCARRKIDFDVEQRGEGERVESLMLQSDDGLVWSKRAVFQEMQGDETAFAFLDQGAILGVARRGRGNAELIRAAPPYAEWERIDLGRFIGGPLLARWGEKWVVGGRKMAPGQEPRTSLYWLENDALTEFAELPSGGDTSYPGFVELSPTQALVSWYSSHESDRQGDPITAIYTANLEIR